MELKSHYIHMTSTAAIDKPKPPTMEERAAAAAATNANFGPREVKVLQDGRVAGVREQNNQDLIVKVNIIPAHQDKFAKDQESGIEFVTGQGKGYNQSDDNDSHHEPGREEETDGELSNGFEKESEEECSPQPRCSR